MKLAPSLPFLYGDLMLDFPRDFMLIFHEILCFFKRFNVDFLLDFFFKRFYVGKVSINH